MQVFSSIADMAAFSKSERNKANTICLVPTMGALHAGHLSLIDMANELADIVVVSIYVNPTQFAPGEDFDKYPRALEADIQQCRDRDVNAVFNPNDDIMYLGTHSTYVEETVLSEGLCGAARPSHFRGVTTVVLKLFNIVQPQFAVFGRKDAQQARVIMRMTRDLNLPVIIRLAPIIREPDGLAMSSRNRYLSKSEREQALTLHRTLEHGRKAIEGGETNAAKVLDAMKDTLSRSGPSLILEYLEIRSDPDLKSLTELKGDIILLIAATLGTTRLIDNVEMSVQ